MKNVVKVDFCRALTHADEMRMGINWVINNLFFSRAHCEASLMSFSRRLTSDRQIVRQNINTKKKNLNRVLSPLKCFGQQTNSTPENNEIPHGSSIAKLRICILRSWHAVAPVWFHRTNGQQRDALWMWSNKQPSGTSKASDWNGPSVVDRERRSVEFRFMSYNWMYLHNWIN